MGCLFFYCQAYLSDSPEDLLLVKFLSITTIYALEKQNICLYNKKGKTKAEFIPRSGVHTGRMLSAVKEEA